MVQREFQLAANQLLFSHGHAKLDPLCEIADFWRQISDF